ncbi:hypothetical protein KIPB_012828, partial [Kipferlia bialata]
VHTATAGTATARSTMQHDRFTYSVRPGVAGAPMRVKVPSSGDLKSPISAAPPKKKGTKRVLKKKKTGTKPGTKAKAKK